ncbi:MAG: acyltransferase family protein [Chloroflexota bacterium]|nr:acyltransferase family protein [Chloroflexota bacterium]
MTSEVAEPGSGVPIRRSLAWIDAARVAAILAVIAIHVVSPLVTNRALPESSWFGNAVDSAARWAVPLFVMISGALLLHSDLADDPLSFYRRRLSRIVPPLVAWTAIYLVIGHLTVNNPATMNIAGYSVLAGRPSSHLYFLYLIAGLYLVAPFLRPLVRLADRRNLGIAVVVFLALGIADDLIIAWGGIGQVNATTRFVPYIGYFLAGAWLVGLAPTRSRIVAAAAVTVVGILATALGTELLIQRLGMGRGLYLYEYLSVTTVPVSLAVFVLFVWSAPAIERMAARLPRGWLSTVAASTLGIYVIHPLVLGGLGRVGLSARAFLVPLAVPAAVLVTFGVSLLLVLVLRRLPAVRRLV